MSTKFFAGWNSIRCSVLLFQLDFFSSTFSARLFQFDFSGVFHRSWICYISRDSNRANIGIFTYIKKYYWILCKKNKLDKKSM